MDKNFVQGNMPMNTNSWLTMVTSQGKGLILAKAKAGNICYTQSFKYGQLRERIKRLFKLYVPISAFITEIRTEKITW